MLANAGEKMKRGIAAPMSLRNPGVATTRARRKRSGRRGASGVTLQRLVLDFRSEAGEIVERIRAEERAQEERQQARMRELVEEARHKAARDAKLRRSQEEKAEGEERLARGSAWRQWKASGGSEDTFDRAWPEMWEEMLKERAVDGDRQAREAMARSRVSRI